MTGYVGAKDQGSVDKPVLLEFQQFMRVKGRLR